MRVRERNKPAHTAGQSGTSALPVGSVYALLADSTTVEVRAFPGSSARPGPGRRREPGAGSRQVAGSRGGGSVMT
jgi:hypothetical protein